jgi:hypothetical protein
MSNAPPGRFEAPRGQVAGIIRRKGAQRRTKVREKLKSRGRKCKPLPRAKTGADCHNPAAHGLPRALPIGSLFVTLRAASDSS